MKDMTEGNTVLRIAVQSKGRLHDDTMEMLSEAGIKVASSKRTLLVASSNFPIEVLYLRDDDIPQAVADGVADVGVVGMNEMLERDDRAEVVEHLGFGACRLSIAVPKASDYDGLRWLNGRSVATSYPNILRRFLKEQAIKADIHVIAGSVEISTGIGLADAIFDIVSSGSTLVQNNLREVETVLKSDAVLIACRSLSDEKRQVLDDLMFRIHAVMAANNKKYVLMNVPKASLQQVLDVLPGIKSPTVLPLADPDWSSVHTVIDEQSFWHIIGKLKEAGAQGILVLPIEKMIV